MKIMDPPTPKPYIELTEQNLVKSQVETISPEALDQLASLLEKRIDKKLQTELDWHKKELTRVDHALVDACDRANKLQAELNDYKQGADVEGREADKLRADIKSVNFSYWKKCEELSELQEQSSNLFNEAKKIFEEYHDQIFYYREELPASWLTIAEKSAKWIDSIWLRSKD